MFRPKVFLDLKFFLTIFLDQNFLGPNFENIFNKYRAENCDVKGNQKNNLSKVEQAGLKSLEKKIKERKLIVITTDKSLRFAV